MAAIGAASSMAEAPALLRRSMAGDVILDSTSLASAA